MKKVTYVFFQCTWGLLQTFLGFILFVIHFRCEHFTYHGAIVTKWHAQSSMSLGLFVFVASEPYFAEKYSSQIPIEDLSNRLLVHEYGHTIQSLILGPLYLVIIGIPSTLWGFAGASRRKSKQIPYGAFFTERWANHAGECVTKEQSIRMLVLD